VGKDDKGAVGVVAPQKSARAEEQSNGGDMAGTGFMTSAGVEEWVPAHVGRPEGLVTLLANGGAVDDTDDSLMDLCLDSLPITIVKCQVLADSSRPLSVSQQSEIFLCNSSSWRTSERVGASTVSNLPVTDTVVEGVVEHSPVEPDLVDPVVVTEGQLWWDVPLSRVRRLKKRARWGARNNG